MSEHIAKSHNKSLLIYHIVCPAKYRRDVFGEEVEETLKAVCVGIKERYEISFVEIGSDEIMFIFWCKVSR